MPPIIAELDEPCMQFREPPTKIEFDELKSEDPVEPIIAAFKERSIQFLNPPNIVEFALCVPIYA